MEQGMSGGQQIKTAKYIYDLGEEPTTQRLFEAMERIPDILVGSLMELVGGDPRRLEIKRLEIQPFVKDGTTVALVGLAIAIVHPVIATAQMQLPSGIVLGGR